VKELDAAGGSEPERQVRIQLPRVLKIRYRGTGSTVFGSRMVAIMTANSGLRSLNVKRATL
jgi:hypothetical protein